MTAKEQLFLHRDELSDRLGRGLAARDKIEKLPPELQLARTQCAMATLALQAMLREDYGITTERLLGAPAQLPLKMGNRRVEHAILVEPDSGMIVDPTYKQFFGLVGLDARRAAHEETVRAFYPEQSIALIQDVSDVRGIVEDAKDIQAMLDDATRVDDELLDAQFGSIWDRTVYKKQEYADFADAYPNSVDMADLAIEEVLRTH